mmetsp:Transcript_81196/g.248107  ORF Transcript_81196/g.248107 Transcript_81196/m.248107 type:complete len:224 (+) Transcript_81196:574-1245(+)
MAPVPTGTSLPSIVTRLPLLSMSSCWMCGTKRVKAWQYGRTAQPSYLRTLTFQTCSRPMISGRFSLGGAVRKCLSMSRPPAWNFMIVSKPYCNDSANTPTALQQENRPPTQSQKPKTFSGMMPNSAVLFSAVEHAATCFATHAGSPSSLMSHSLTVLALSIVSAVVNVLETTKTNVVSALSPSSARLTSMGSTLAKKRSRRPAAATAASGSVFRASKTNSTPR